MTGFGQSGIMASGRPGDLARAALPFLTVFVLICVDLAPLPSAAPTTIAPLFSLAAIFYWTVQRPDLLGNGLILILTLLLDAASGMPLGLTALALFATRLVLLAPRRFLSSRSFAVLWACFSLVALLLLGLRWVIACLFWQEALPLRPVLFEILLTIAAYPLVSLALAFLLPVLPKPSHAASRG